MEFLSQAFAIILLVVGFGFVIFWHELGHFLAAKWVGIRVEQFAVGMGHALVSWRRGIGLKFGSTRAEYTRRAREYLEKRGNAKDSASYTDAELYEAGDALGLGETEYRLSWIPVGGYVKMLGQDDMDPTRQADDPRAYNKKSVGARMLVISAGVIMNVILALILFIVLFLYGFTAPAPVVGQVLANSPAEKAGIRVGDELISYDGAPMHDFNKIRLATALSAPNEEVKVAVRRPDGTREELTVRPTRATPEERFVGIGVGASPTLAAPPVLPKLIDPAFEVPEARDLNGGDVITAVNGKPVQLGDPKKGTTGDYVDFYRALQQATPDRPVALTVKGADGKERTVNVRPHLPIVSFGNVPTTFAGMEPRMAIGFVASKDSPAYGKVKSGDALRQLTVYTSSGKKVVDNPTLSAFLAEMQNAGQNGFPFDIRLDRAGQPEPLPILNARTIKLDKAGKLTGLGVQRAYDEASTVVGAVAPNSPAAAAKIPAGAVIQSVDGKPVRNWFEVKAALLAAGPDAAAPATHDVTYAAPGAAEPTSTKLALDAGALADLKEVHYEHHLLLAELNRVRQTGNPMTAAAWGVTETRDLILQFYVTLRRIATGGIGADNLMGPIGIFGAGAQFAFRGTDWLIWFLAMISANLAVVNFLPIPIVDGGHFVFLVVEKLKGRPPSKRVMEYAQLAGLVFILGVFLFVSYNDILRLVGRQ